jgi:tryptophan synthase beta chain
VSHNGPVGGTTQAALAPDTSGHFGDYGGRFVPESLISALVELEAQYAAAKVDPSFQAELSALLRGYAGRPTLLTPVPRFSAAAGCEVVLKREDLAHTGSHKINNVLGQVLNVARMRMVGAEVIPVTIGSGTLKDAMNEAFRDWVTTVASTHYCIGSVGGPHPFPVMVRDFQRVIGVEARSQILEQAGRLPDAVIACVGGGSNSIGIFHAFLADEPVRLIGCEAGGEGLDTGRHAATMVAGSDGVLHGMRTRVLQDSDGQTLATHSISAGLDYPGVGPEHAWLAENGRASYRAITDAEAMEAFSLLCRTEGIIPALESAHALAGALQVGKETGSDALLVVNLSGRGDKDVTTASRWFGHLSAEALDAAVSQ